jgi:hypothetical protein
MNEFMSSTDNMAIEPFPLTTCVRWRFTSIDQNDAQVSEQIDIPPLFSVQFVPVLYLLRFEMETNTIF